MQARWPFSVLLLSSLLMAQSSPPTPCPADRPVDDIITEIHNQQAKKKSRNKNPLPSSICIFGWCHQTAKTEPTTPQSTTAAPEASPESSSSATQSGYSKCDEAMDRALEAAHDVDVGDTYFKEKNYRAATMRYEDASEQKGGDVAILVRLGRAYEKMNQPDKALEQYQAAEKLTGPEKWTQEAKAGAARLQGGGGE